MRSKQRQDFDTILESVSEILFPDRTGTVKVTVTSVGIDGDTPLHWLVRRSDRYAVKILLEHGADPNVQGDMGETPLHVAVGEGDLQVLQLLLESGARTDVKSEFGDSPKERANSASKEIRRMFRNAT